MSEVIKEIKILAYQGKSAEEIFNSLAANKWKFSDADMEEAKRKIDDYVVMYQLAIQAKSAAWQQMVMGLLIFVLGSAITTYTFIKNGNHFVLLYGAIITGAYIFFKGYLKYKMPIEDLVPKKVIVKKKF